MVVVIAAALGMAFGFGLLLVVTGLVGTGHRVRRARPVDLRAIGERWTLELGLAVGSGVVVFLLTRWLAGGLLAALGAVALPRVLAGGAARATVVERTEAVAAWAEMLRDTMAAAAGIEEAIISTAPISPAPIREPLRRLAARLEHERLVPALRELAEELADPTADLVVTALVLATERQTRDLGALLGALARAARTEASLLLRIEAGRSRTRTAARVVTATTVGFAVLLVVFNRPFLEPYDNALGQAWLLVVGGLFAASIWQLDRMARIATPPRLLSGRRAATRIA